MDRDGATRPSVAHDRRRGLHMLGHPYVMGTVIGAIGASAFVLSNRGSLAEPWSGVALGAYLVALGWYLWAVFWHPRVVPDISLRRGAGWIYLVSVIGMIALIQVGRLALEGIGRLDLAPSLIAVLVGLHFIPFGYGFGARVFYPLGWSLAALGTIGVVAGLLIGSWAAAAGAVLSGVWMLTLLGLDAQRSVGDNLATERGVGQTPSHFQRSQQA